MPSTFEKAFAQVQELVATFRASEQYFLSAEFSEAETRKTFIDKFFAALGWDVNHDQQKNPYEQEVKIEKNEDGSQRRTDYAFFLSPNFHDVRFFVEAKKPHGEFGSPDNYFQTIRYGWPHGTPLAVLTNFNDFHILDCRYEPNIGDTLSRVVKRFTYDDYADSEKFAEIYWLFSREAVANNSLSKFADNLPRPKSRTIRSELFKRGDQPPDESFLIKLDEYRETLAKAFKAKNPNLDGEELTEVTQRTLDRLIFIRFLEDKLIEPKRRVEHFGTDGKNTWEDFISASLGLDRTYNGVVFKRHEILDAPGFQVNEKVFKRICEELSDPTSPYNFDAIPIHILGSIYERFLGKVIIADKNGAHVEEKPEVRKAGGVYYTPQYIVRYIVESTVGKLIDGKTPAQISEMRFADIACGSGSFLLGVFDLLLRHHTKFYNENPSKAKKDCIKRDDGLHLSLQKKQEILRNNIYGVDIDHQAVEVAQLSLYLKLLEDETLASAHAFQIEFHYTLLPSLAQNIVCGNSLVGTDVLLTNKLTEEEQKKLNPMNFADRFPQIIGQGGFDAIIGNPPYDVMEKERGESSWPHFVLTDYGRRKSNYESALGGKLNLFRFFIVKMFELVRWGGRAGMIVPMAVLADISCAATRRHFLFNAQNILADCFPQKDNANRRVFKDAKLSTTVITGTKTKAIVPKDAQIHVKVYPWNKFEDKFRECQLRYPDFSQLDPIHTPIPLVDSAQWEVCRKLFGKKSIVRLGCVADFQVARGEINQTIYREFISEDSSHARLLKGVEVARFGFNKKLQQGHREWFDERQFLKSNGERTSVKQRRIATQRITGVDERLRIVAAIKEPPAYFADSTNSITIQVKSFYQLEYLLGLLNSTFFQWRFKLTSSNNNVGTNELESMPFRVIDFSDSADKAKHDKLVSLVEQMLAAKPQLASAKSDKDKDFYKNKCAALDRQIDALVYELYQLSEDEINIVKEQASYE